MRFTFAAFVVGALFALVAFAGSEAADGRSSEEGMTVITRFCTRYAWAGPIIGAVIGFLAAQYWKSAEVRIADRTVTIQEVLAQKALYERLQILQNQASEAILKYIDVRDRRFSDSNAPRTREDHEKARGVERLYEAEKGKLVALIREYNQLEAKLSTMERRSPRFFVLPLPSMPPRNLRIETSKTGPVFKWDPPAPDPLVSAVKQDLQELFRQYGQEYREKPPEAEKK